MATLVFEFYLSAKNIEDANIGAAPGLVNFSRDVSGEKDITAVFNELVTAHHVPAPFQFELLARLKLCCHFPNLDERRRCLEIRLVSPSVLLLSHPDQAGDAFSHSITLVSPSILGT